MLGQIIQAHRYRVTDVGFTNCALFDEANQTHQSDINRLLAVARKAESKYKKKDLFVPAILKVSSAPVLMLATPRKGLARRDFSSSRA